MSLDVSQDCCLGMPVRLTMATSRFLSLTYCQLVLVGASTLGCRSARSYRLWQPWQRHQTNFSLYGYNAMRKCNQAYAIGMLNRSIIMYIQAYATAHKSNRVGLYYSQYDSSQVYIQAIIKQLSSYSRPILKLVICFSCRPILKLYPIKNDYCLTKEVVRTSLPSLKSLLEG